MKKTLLFSLLFITLILSFSFKGNDDVTDALSQFNGEVSAFTDLVPNDSCAVLNPEAHDDATHENGYLQVSDSSRWVHKLRPSQYPWTYTKICVGFTKTGATTSLTYDIVIYDSTASGPGNLRAIYPGQTITGIPQFPGMIWSSTVVSVPVSSGAIYAGIRYDNNPNLSIYISVDQSASTPQWPIYNATASPPVWNLFTSARALCVRAEGLPGGGAVNRCLRLPTPGVNSNYVMIPFQSGMVGFPNLTIEAWVKIGGSTTANTVLNKGAGSFDYQLGINSTTTNPFFRCQGVVTLATTMTISVNVWTHLAVTYDGTTVRFYKDGALGFSSTTSSPPGSSSNEMRLGRGNADAGSGNLEEVRLWSVARTQGAIDSNRCRKYPSQFSSSAGLKALWHLDSTYTDSVSNFNGTPVGNVGFDTVSFPIPGVNCNLVGIQQIGNKIPEVYSLEQNYPNPFNPKTNITFSIPKDGFVELVVYDILGKKVAVLVQDPHVAGTYRVDFNAANLASGVYFYTITVNDFTETKKMLLIK